MPPSFSDFPLAEDRHCCPPSAEAPSSQSPVFTTEKGIIPQAKALINSASHHAHCLIKLAQLEAGEAQACLIKKLLCLAFLGVFLFVFYLTLNGAFIFSLASIGLCLPLAFGIVSLGNLILGLACFLLARKPRQKPFFSETLNELETDLLCLKEITKQKTP